MTQMPSRKEAWKPPARPGWVASLNNEGTILDARSVVPLTADELIATAKANTGLTDFGADDWEEPFRRYVESVDREGHLHLMGRLMTRSDLLMLLEARLKIEDTYRRHPEIDDEVVNSPIWIFGQGRSGTSLLQTLMGLDPANRCPLQYETLFPTETDDAGKRQLADQRISQWNRVTPEIASMHEFAGEMQAETIQFEALSFRCAVWLNLFGMAPSYNAWFATQPYELAYSYLKRVLKLLQWRQPRRVWILKSPDSIHYLPQALSVFPDARFVWAHRDPVKTMASAVSLVSTLAWIRSDQRFPDGAFDGVTHPSVVVQALSRPIDWLENGVIPKELLCSIQYADLIADPVGTLQKIYEFHRLPFSLEAQQTVADYLKQHQREARPAHNYSLGQQDQLANEREVFSTYQTYFNVPNEF